MAEIDQSVRELAAALIDVGLGWLAIEVLQLFEMETEWEVPFEEVRRAREQIRLGKEWLDVAEGNPVPDPRPPLEVAEEHVRARLGDTIAMFEEALQGLQRLGHAQSGRPIRYALLLDGEPREVSLADARLAGDHIRRLEDILISRRKRPDVE